MSEPLSGYRIVDLSWGIAGPIGTMLLAEQGAEVVKVEPPGGDPFRAGPGYPVWNRSKKSVVLDLKTDDGKAAFRSLLTTADVLVESFTPGTMEKWGLGYDQIKADFPRLIYLALPGYPSKSSRAQRPGYDPLIAAWSGQQFTQEAVGRPDGPAYLFMPMPSMGSCYLAATAVNTALFVRERTGRGQRVETSLLQGSLLYTTMIWQYHEHTEKVGAAIPKTANTTLFECADGRWVHLMKGAKGAAERVAKILGLEPEEPSRRMTLGGADQRARQELERKAILKITQADLLEQCWANDIPVQPVQSMDKMYTDPQFIHNDMVQTVVDPELGETTQIGIPFRLDYAPGSIKGGQPRVGEHTGEILDALDLPADLRARLSAASIGER